MSALCLFQEISPVKFISATTRLVRSEAFSVTTKTRLRQFASAKPNPSVSLQELILISTSMTWLAPSYVPRSSPVSMEATLASPSLRIITIYCLLPPLWVTCSVSMSEMERPFVHSKAIQGQSTTSWRFPQWRSWSQREKIATAVCSTSGVLGPSDLIN